MISGRRILGGAVALAFLLAGETTLDAGQREVPKGDPDAGRRAYLRTGCYQCHGREGQGSPSTGPRLGPSPSSFSAFTAWVRRPGGEMPPYTNKILTDAELADIYEFLRTRPRAVPASRLP